MEPGWPTNLKYLLPDTLQGTSANPRAPPSLGEGFPHTYRELLTARLDWRVWTREHSLLPHGRTDALEAKHAPPACSPHVPGPGSPCLTLCFSTADTPSHSPAPSRQGLLVGPALLWLLFKPPCLSEKQTDDLGNHMCDIITL